MSICRSCGAPVRWVVTAKNGKAMPVDLPATPTGNVEVMDDDTCIVHAQPQLAPLGEMHTSHFATCPNADEWRKR